MDMAEALLTIRKAREALKGLDAAEKTLQMVGQAQRAVEAQRAKQASLLQDLEAADAQLTSVRAEIVTETVKLENIKRRIRDLAASLAGDS